MSFNNPPLRGLFVTGTDTGVGKTTISRALLRLAFQAKHPTHPCKPTETGAAPDPADAIALRQAARCELPLERICPFPFSAPIAPSLAAELVGCPLSAAMLAAACRTTAALSPNRALLVEGAGGLLTPLSARETNAELASLLGLPVLLVARNALGTINHTALALEALDRRGLHLAGLILVDTTPAAAPDRPHNARAITALTGVAPLGEFPHAPAASDDELANLLAKSVRYQPLLACLAPGLNQA